MTQKLLPFKVQFHINNDFFCTNILEDQAQWCDKTEGLSKLVIVKQCVFVYPCYQHLHNQLIICYINL